jgi:hypothetical protein
MKTMSGGLISDAVIQRLLRSDEASIRYKTLVRLAGCDPGSSQARTARDEIRASPVVKALLSERDPETGEIPLFPYHKWRGAHWVLACLADLEYPPGDETLRPLMEQVYSCWLSPEHLKSVQAIDGRVRRCASQQGNALYASLALGLADDRSDVLARWLIQWQWPDGGWNCDKRPEAINSSFFESLIPLRALSLYARFTGDLTARQAAERAADVFLKRELFKRRSDGSPIRSEFLILHYPCYWRYDILFALKVMMEAGFLGDPRCWAALEMLRSKRLTDGGFPAEGKFYHLADKPNSGRSLADWGGGSKTRLNEFVTVDAYSVLKSLNP